MLAYIAKAARAALLSSAIAGCYDLASLTRGADASAGAADLSAGTGDLMGVCDRAPDGTVCAPNASPCVRSGTCKGGSCQPQTPAPSGTVCQTSTDPCRTDAVCDASGVCGEQGVRPDGYGYDAANPINRCCGGTPVPVNTAQNCGVCGISCGAQPCLYEHGPHWHCGCADNGQCWSGCCVRSYGEPYVCGAGTCVVPSQPLVCPGGGMIGNDNLSPYYCHY